MGLIPYLLLCVLFYYSLVQLQNLHNSLFNRRGPVVPAETRSSPTAAMAPSVAVENLNPKVRNAARSPSPCLPVLSLEGPILRDSSEGRLDFDDLEEVLWVCCTDWVIASS